MLVSMSRRLVGSGLALVSTACRPDAAAIEPPPARASAPAVTAATTEHDVPQLGGVAPTHHASWAALYAALANEATPAKEEDARRWLCRDRCSGPPPWLVAHRPRESANLEWRLVTPTRDHTLAVTPVIVSFYDGTCESSVEAEIDPAGAVRNVVLHVVEQHVAPRGCPPSEEVCDDTCAEVPWDCTLRVVPETLEMVIDTCTAPPPPDSLP